MLYHVGVVDLAVGLGTCFKIIFHNFLIHQFGVALRYDVFHRISPVFVKLDVLLDLSVANKAQVQLIVVEIRLVQLCLPSGTAVRSHAPLHADIFFAGTHNRIRLLPAFFLAYRAPA